MKSFLPKARKIDKIKMVIEGFFYQFGFKLNFSYPKIEEFEDTKDLALQFKNLSTIKQWIEGLSEYYKQHDEKFSSHYPQVKLGNPDLLLTDANEDGLKHYALIWHNKDQSRFVKVIYRDDGQLCWVARAYNNEGEKSFGGMRGGLHSVYQELSSLYRVKDSNKKNKIS